MTSSAPAGSSKPYVKYAIIAVLAAAAGFGIYRWRSGPKASTLKYETVKVERGKLVARVTATGTLSALVTVQVGAQVSGRIARLNADFNSRVKKGQTIAKIDPALFMAALEQARANRIAAQGNVVKARAQALDARRQAERAKALRKDNLVAQADADTAESNAAAAAAGVAAALGQLAQTNASLHQATINLNYTTIVSPIDGVVISRNVDVGQTVAAALQAPTLFTIAQDLGLMQVDTSVAESDVGKLQPGGPAWFTVDAYPNERFLGTIRQIRNAPQTVQNVVTYDAVIDVKNPDLKLKPGMTANVTFVYAEKDGVLKLPNSAMRFRPSAEMQAMANAGKPDGGAPADKGGGGSGRDGGTEAVASGRGAGGEGKGGWAGRGGGGGGNPSMGPGGGGAWRGGGRGGSPDRRSVWVLRPGADKDAPATPAQVSVKVGITDGTASEILEGELREGDQVITDVSGGSSAPASPGGAPGGGGGGPPMRRLF